MTRQALPIDLDFVCGSGLLWLHPVGAGRSRSAASTPAASPKPAKKLIEFGWDEPDTASCASSATSSSGRRSMAVSFTSRPRAPAGKPENFAWLCWGRRRFSEAELKPAIADLESINWTRFRHNFLRFNVTPADLDWFDDYAAVVSNARLAAQVARGGPLPGNLARHRGLSRKALRLPQAARRQPPLVGRLRTQARLRGREVMTAFQEGFPDVTVLRDLRPQPALEAERRRQEAARRLPGRPARPVSGRDDRGGDRENRGSSMATSCPTDTAIRRFSSTPARRSRSRPPGWRPIRLRYQPWSPPASASGSITTGPSTAGTPPSSRATISPPSDSSRACERPRASPMNMCGSIPRNRAGGRNEVPRSICRSLCRRRARVRTALSRIDGGSGPLECGGLPPLLWASKAVASHRTPRGSSPSIFT